MTSQGWQPGNSLGATDASHAAHYTAASQSHIRVFLKDDNLGLGAKRGSERAENFGLAGLESILGRLNGNEAEVKKEEERREEIEKRAFVYRKYGMMNFVSGGFLVGDKITKKSDIKKEVEIKTETEIKSEPESDGGAVDKKRKREERTEEEPKLKRKKKSTDLGEDRKTESDTPKSKKDKKDKKKDKSKKSKRESSSDPEPSTDALATPASDPEPLTEKARRKAEKKARKEEKKAKKALKKAAKKAAKKDSSDDSSSESSDEESTPAVSSVPVSGASTPAGLTYNPRGMHAVRQRYIRQKKAATMDAQAMREVRPCSRLCKSSSPTNMMADFHGQNTIVGSCGA